MRICPPVSFRARSAIIVVLLAIFVSAQAMCEGTNDPLIDLLLKKGVISQDEAAQVEAEAVALRTNEAAAITPSKWKISAGIKNVELFGDLRVRYEGRSATDPNGGSIDLRRYRYALRFGLRGDVFDDFYYGFRMDTASNPRSPWVNFGSATASGTGQYQGPFGKSQGGINVGQIYLGWRPASWLDITIGKMPQPLYTTPMLWDTDFNPEGLAERLKYTVGKMDLFANFGQFFYEDLTPSQAAAGYFPNIQGYSNAAPPFLLAWQLGFNFHATERLSVKAAGTIYNYTGRGANAAQTLNNPNPDFSGIFVGQGSVNPGLGNGSYNLANLAVGSGDSGASDGFYANQTGINDLMVLDIPAELNYKMDKLNIRLFGDFAENLNGRERAEAAFAASQNLTLFPNGGSSSIVRISSPQKNDIKAYQVGVAVGNKDSLGLVYGTTSRKNAWEARTYWQHMEQYALDPNLIDSDFFEGRANMQGIYAAFAYGFTDNFTGTVRYGYAKQINPNLGTGGSNQDIPQMNPINQYDVLQVDLAFRF